MMLWWLRQRDKLPYTPPWIRARREKFSRLAQLNITSLTKELPPEEVAEQKILRSIHSRHVKSWWRTAFL